VQLERWKGIERGRDRILKTLNISKQEVERGLELHRKSIVIDSLGGDPEPWSTKMIQKMDELVKAGKPAREVLRECEKLRRREIVESKEYRKDYLEHWTKSGVTCAVQGDIKKSLWDLPSALNGISQFEYRFTKLKDILVKATTAKDIRDAKSQGKHALIMDLQNSVLLGGGVDVDRELENLELLYGLGIRAMQLTYNLRNFVGDGCTERNPAGLSHFGVRVVEEMNRLGMLVDVAHCSPKTTLDAVEFSKDPIVATHTSCRSVYDHPRAKSDEELKAVAEKGGYVGILVLETFIAKQGTIKDFLDHIDYAVKLIGVGHVGIGTDHDLEFWPKPPQSWLDKTSKERNWWYGYRPEHRAGSQYTTDSSWEDFAWTNWPYFTVGLVSRGYSDQEIQKLIGGNFLALFERVVG